MIHLSKFKVVQFRGISGTSLPKLSQANLVTGKNGVGKTALIEAVWLFSGRYNPGIIWNQQVQRTNKPIVDPLSRLSEGNVEIHGEEKRTDNQLNKVKFQFERFPVSTQPILSGSESGEKFVQFPEIGKLEVTINGKQMGKDKQGFHPIQHHGVVTFNQPGWPIDWPNSGLESARLHFDTDNNYLHNYSKMVREGKKIEIIDALKLVQPEVNNIEILIEEAGESYLSAQTRDIQLPLQNFGGGIIRFFRLLVSFSTCKDGILAVDEIENGFHFSVMEEVWRLIRDWMRKWDVQIIATTHSAECIKAAITVFKEFPEDLSIHNLYRSKDSGNIEVATFNGETLEGASDLNLELR